MNKPKYLINGFKHIYDCLVKSKARKPSAEGIKKILKHFAFNPEETIFTDDLVKNLIEADKLGVNTIHFEHIDLFKDLLEDFKVNISEE
jgi:HAD superfamily hydrolase (TIGR01509 family)